MFGDTIAALATAAGEAGVSLVRVSGPAALAIASAVFRPVRGGSLERAVPRRVYYGQILEGPGGAPQDDGLAWFMPAPGSYTGEDVVEISGHGGAVASRLVLEALLRAGARLAEPGEFTRRAFLNGRLDLAQAEATIDVVRARTREAHAAARQRLTGGLSRQVGGVAVRLLGLMAEMEARGDFPDLELTELQPEQISRELRGCAVELERLLEGAERGRLLREGLRVVLVGRPNVGKSSLLNALLGEERAIVSEAPGTTRDTIEEGVSIEGVPVVLVDTAGLRESGDQIEMAGVARTDAALAGADLAVLVIDAGAGWTAADAAAARRAAGLPVLLVVNKADLGPYEPAAAAIAEAGEVRGSVRVSALAGTGLTRLREEIARVAALRGGEAPLVATMRQRDAVERAIASLRLADGAALAGVPLDLVAVDVRGAREALGELTGESAPEAVIDEIFSRFCIGK